MAAGQVDLAILATAVRQAGGEPAQVAHVLELFHQRLIADGQPSPQTLYVYRTTSAAARSDKQVSTSPARTRLLLAFLSADAAVSFAQRAGLARVPRLLPISLARMLAVLLQQPAMSAVHIAYDDTPAADGLPVGWHIARADVLAMFSIDSGVV
ncbi:hypothetical protein [Chloroflexus sp.]|uniref:hypothetical protein n=1 Tax=Chloroflexus sp. TaxID=1904827 RepID=UPI00298EDAE5|nr:hypothetical protein [Chloroflexus sp.]MDW8405353.1 hypothetical protein [Chloroflexus sp.]